MGAQASLEKQNATTRFNLFRTATMEEYRCVKAVYVLKDMVEICA